MVAHKVRRLALKKGVLGEKVRSYHGNVGPDAGPNIRGDKCEYGTSGHYRRGVKYYQHPGRNHGCQSSSHERYIGQRYHNVQYFFVGDYNRFYKWRKDEVWCTGVSVSIQFWIGNRHQSRDQLRCQQNSSTISNYHCSCNYVCNGSQSWSSFRNVRRHFDRDADSHITI